MNDLSASELPTDGMPRVEILLQNAAPDVAYVTIMRTAKGRTFPVRGAIERAVAGAFTVVDFECPFNTPVEYRGDLLNASREVIGVTNLAVLGEVVSGLLPEDDLLPADDVLPDEFLAGSGLISADSWMHNPLKPEGGVRVQLAPSAGASTSRPVPGAMVYPRGRRVGVVVSQPRRGVTGHVMDVRCTTVEDADKVQALIGGYDETLTPVVCIRLGGDDARMRVPQPLFLGVFDIVEEDIDVRWGGGNTSQRIEGSEAAPPAPGVFIPLLRRADLNAFYASRAALDADNLTRLAINRKYELAGYAG